MKDEQGRPMTCCNCEFKKKGKKARKNSEAPCRTCDKHYSCWLYKDWTEG